MGLKIKSRLKCVCVNCSGLKLRHSLETNKYPYVSPTTVQVPSSKADLTDTARYPLVKAHGEFILITYLIKARLLISLSAGVLRPYSVIAIM